jgi:hypothetical protein
MRESIGKPQYLAILLLLLFLAQCVWLIGRYQHSGNLEAREAYRVETGLRLWRGTPPAADLHSQLAAQPSPRIEQNGGIDPDHSDLWYLIPSAPVLLWSAIFRSNALQFWGWLTRLPYLAFGALLGASLWYVSRRLYGNAGGFIALTLYCFSPGIIRTTAVWFTEPEIGAAWAAFGAIFTGIAVAHTLYAPREVILWNWRRIVLLGISITLAIGSQFSLWVLVLLALVFMLYLAPTRRGAALVIWSASCLVAIFFLIATYGFQFGPFVQAVRHARWLDATPRAFAMPGALTQLLARLGENSAALLLLLPVAIVVYFAWPRARYFGNTAPLLVGTVCLLIAWITPHYPGQGFQFVALPFFFVFVAGILSDLLETRHRVVVLSGIFGLLSAYAVLNLMRLLQAGIAP